MIVLKKRNEHGFTLIELLISASIIAVIFSLIYGVFFNVLAGKQRAENMGEIYQGVRVVLNIFENDIRSATPFAHSQPVFKGEDREEGGASMDRLKFTSLSSLYPSSRDANQTLIEYVPDYNPETKQVILYRNEIPILIKETLKEEERFELSTNLYGLNIRYFGDNRWHDVWDFSGKNRFPDAVEIELSLLDLQGEKVSFLNIFRIGVRE